MSEELMPINKIKEIVAVQNLEVNPDTKALDIVKASENNILQTDTFQKITQKVGEERIKADLAQEASRIRTKNIQTAENEYKNETRELKIKHLKAEMILEHKHNMETLEQDARHKQMLSYRKKLVEKYSYLYSCKEDEMITAYDKDGKPYKVPKDFSYSAFINRVRQFGRNVSKLDRPILQTFKWIFIIGGLTAAYFILQRLGIMR